MCERYLATVQSQKPKTILRKPDIAKHLKRDFPGGADVPVGKVIHSRIAAWLSSYPVGAASFNHYLMFIRSVFDLAIADKVLLDNPTAGTEHKVPADPIRITPTPEEFRAIVADIRAQPEYLGGADSGDFVGFVGLAR